jgi:hypothetical protein
VSRQPLRSARQQSWELQLRSFTQATTQSFNASELLETIQAKPERRPHAIVLSPAGTALHRVALAGAKANIGWVVLNLDAAYIASVRRMTCAPVFAVSSDHSANRQTAGGAGRSSSARGRTSCLRPMVHRSRRPLGSEPKVSMKRNRRIPAPLADGTMDGSKRI